MLPVRHEVRGIQFEASQEQLVRPSAVAELRDDIGEPDNKRASRGASATADS